ncbi:uncharacterized [Tachysurus ichikawai]
MVLVIARKRPMLVNQYSPAENEVDRGVACVSPTCQLIRHNGSQPKGDRRQTQLASGTCGERTMRRA